MGIIQTTNKITGSLRRVWRYAGTPSNGTSGTFAGQAEKGDLLIDSTNAKLYMNTNTTASPTWTENAQTAGSGVSLGVVGDMAANGTSTANSVGVGTTAASIDHVHKLGTHDHSDNTKGGATIGAVTIASMTLSGDIDMSGQGTGTYDFILKTDVADALSIRDSAGDLIVFKTTTGAQSVTITPATTITGILTASTGLTVSAGGITVTGDSIITGALEVTGALTIGGAWTLGATLTVDELILDTDGVAPAASNCYVVRDNTGDLTLNAITGKEIHLAINGVDVLDVGTIVEIISGGLTITAGGLTISASGATITGASSITGNLTVTGDLAVTGSFSFGGALTINDTVTVDELILDTDGTAPAGTNSYVVSDNTGDLTLNALTGKKIHLAINGTDEYDFSATILDFNGNAADNVGFLILNAATAPAGTEVYAVNDNTGDLTLNALTGKSVILAINGTDEYTFNATAFQVASANFVQFMGNNGIKDSNGNEVILVEAVADATSYLNVKNSNGAAVTLECLGTADMGFILTNDQDEEILILTPVASAVNEITILNAASGGQPAIRVTGTDGDNGLEIQNKAGEIMLETASTATPVNWLTISNRDTTARPILKVTGEADIGLEIHNAADEICFATVSTNAPTVYLQVSPANTGAQPIIKVMGEADLGLEIQNADGEIECEFISVSTPVNWLSISNSATGNPVILLNPGEDDIGFSFQAKNAEPMLNLAAVAVAKDYIVITSAITTEAPTIRVAGDTDNIDLSLGAKGTGYVRIDANVDMSDNTLYGSAGANGNLILSSTYNATKGYIGIASGEEGLKIGGTADRAGAVGDNALHIFNGAAAPAGALANGISLYSEGGECKVLDAAGNSTTISPHTEDGDYVIHSYSNVKDETVTIHLEKLVKALADDPKLAKFVTVEKGHIKKAKSV
jgi:hypothetical protein